MTIYNDLKKFNPFAPKRIILDAVCSKLDGTGVTKVILIFSVDTDNYKIMVSNKDGKAMKLDVTEDELTTIKKIFIKKIVQAWQMKFDDEPKDVIIQIDIENRDIELFVENYHGDVQKFDY